MTDKRLIEEAFPLKQASLASVHEKNVRHGHISTLHIWPARRPLAACRAAIIAALLPDPGTPEARKEIVRRIGGEVVEDDGKAKVKGGILQWGTEQGPDVAHFREEIRNAFGGRAPKVLDMFAGGGAIPLEAMRLGCDVTAIDYNPVAWFILKCTLEYPQKLAGKRWPLPADASDGLLKGQTDGDLADHVRYWGNWVLQHARKDLAPYYPTLPLNPSEPEGPDNPLCPTVAYLWARTVPHPDAKKNGLAVPLLKTLWLCKKPGKKRALRLKYNVDANRFDFEVFAPENDGEVAAALKRTNGVQCPPTYEGEKNPFMPSDQIQQCGRNGSMGITCTAVIVDVPRGRKVQSSVPSGKEYRAPTDIEVTSGERLTALLDELSRQIPLGLPSEPICPDRPSPNTRGLSGLTRYGLCSFDGLFAPRQMLALGVFVRAALSACQLIGDTYADVPETERPVLVEAIRSYLAVALDRLADYNSAICAWDANGEYMTHTFMKYALPMKWDFAEVCSVNDTTGAYPGGIDWIRRVIEHTCRATADAGPPEVLCRSAAEPNGEGVYDLIITDPPYYDAIPYADLSDFFYIWLRRSMGSEHLGPSLTPKAGELVQHAGRLGGDNERAKQLYEDGMARAFSSACEALRTNGRMVVVFAHKHPDAWETLVTAMIRAGFVVTASWPIETEMMTRSQAQGAASLSSSVWLVCRKRTVNAAKGWYKQVQPRMKERITERLRYFWDEGVRGPDFLWSAVGPGLEAFSAYDEVRRNDGSVFTVSEFLKEVRRLTTDFALGQIVHGGTEGLDDWTRYALMHAQNFGIGGTPVGECILLSGAYGLDLGTLTGQRGILTKGKAKPSATNGDEEEEPEVGGSGSEIRLLTWEERTRDDLGEPQASGELHMVDVLHRLMREWASGDATRAAMYADQQGLGQNDLFWRVAQAFAEMSALGSRERSVLEAIISWGRGRVASLAPDPKAKAAEQPTLDI